MRHYEIMLLIHPDRSDQVSSMIQRYTQLVLSSGGRVHRVEELGRRSLAYPIAKLNKAYYILLNIECSLQTEQELKANLSFNDAVIRNLSIRQDKAVKEPSILNPDRLKQNAGSEKAPNQPTEKAINPRKQSKYTTLPLINDANLDYKNAILLAHYLTDTKKIARRRVVGGTAKQQHRLSQAIKRARFVGLLPYCDKYIQPEIS